MDIEKLDICNIIEVQKIREILIEHPDLLSIFEILYNRNIAIAYIIVKVFFQLYFSS